MRDKLRPNKLLTVIADIPPCPLMIKYSWEKEIRVCG